MSGANWLALAVIAATLLGPILAVQVQKFLERKTETARRREWVLTNVLSTRGTRLHPDHIRSLNLIELAYYDGGRKKRSPACQLVLDAWRAYHAHLRTNTDKFVDADWPAFSSRRDDLFLKLLEAMAKEQKLEIDPESLRSGSYTPVITEQVDQESHDLRKAALRLLRGEESLKVSSES